MLTCMGTDGRYDAHIYGDIWCIWFSHLCYDVWVMMIKYILRYGNADYFATRTELLYKSIQTIVVSPGVEIGLIWNWPLTHLQKKSPAQREGFLPVQMIKFPILQPDNQLGKSEDANSLKLTVAWTSLKHDIECQTHLRMIYPVPVNPPQPTPNPVFSWRPTAGLSSSIMFYLLSSS